MIEGAALKEYRDKLKARAQGKRALALVKPIAKKRENLSVPELLKQILEFLRNYKPGNPEKAKFEVTERDVDGKVKSFKVES